MTLPNLVAWPGLVDDKDGKWAEITIVGTEDGVPLAQILAGEHHDKILMQAFGGNEVLQALQGMHDLFADHAQYDEDGYETAAINAAKVAIENAKEDVRFVPDLCEQTVGGENTRHNATAQDLMDIVDAFVSWYDQSDGDTSDLAFVADRARAIITQTKKG
jgi:hypothetical protein